MSTAVLDPYEVATQAAERSSHFFGKMETNARFVSGFGKNAPEWTEGMNPDDRKTQIELRLNPIDAMGVRFAVSRTMIAEFSDWQRITWPSLRDLGCKTPRDINGKFVHIELVNGRSYTNKTSGETVQPTQMKFIAVYDNEAACTSAWENEYGTTSEAHTPASTPQPANDDAGRATALQFLPALVKMANGDRNVLATTIAGMPQIAPYFTVDSPEVVALMAA